MLVFRPRPPPLGPFSILSWSWTALRDAPPIFDPIYGPVLSAPAYRFLVGWINDLAGIISGT